MATIQERMHAVLQAAHVYKERYTVMADVFTLLHQMMREGTITPAEAMERFFSQLNAGTISIEAAGVIEAEQTRYALTRKRNAYMREYQRKKRGGAGASAALRAPYDDAGASCGAALRAHYDDAATNALSLAEIEEAIARSGAGAFGAPSDGGDANAMSLAEAAVASACAFGAPSNNAAALRAPSDAASAAAAPSASFDAELSADDLL